MISKSEIETFATEIAVQLAARERWRRAMPNLDVASIERLIGHLAEPDLDAVFDRAVAIARALSVVG